MSNDIASDNGVEADKNDTISSANDTATLDELMCPICNESMHISDCKYPLICEAQACNFNMCHACVSNLLSTSNEGPQEASDGNLYSIELQCPSSRGAFEVSLNDILILRNSELQNLLRDVPDPELNAKELRLKYDVSDDKLMALYKAREIYAAAESKKARGTCTGERDDEFGMDDLNDEISTGDEASLAVENEIKVRAALKTNSRMKDKIDFVESMLFQGIGECMSDAERSFVGKLMTSGSTSKLMQAAQLFEGIIAMNAVPVPKSISGNQASTPTNANSHENAQRPGGAGVDISSTAKPVPLNRPKSINGRRVPPQKAFAASVATIPRALSHTQTEFQLEAAQRREWSAMYPLPFRMPRAYRLALDFDPYDRKKCPMVFADDEVTLSFLNNQKYSQINYEDRCKIVNDAFSYLSISMWKKVVKRDCSNFLGAENILLGLEKDGIDRMAPDERIPWRRVMVSHVDRSISRSAGLRVGDVVTHLDGEVFDGNVEKLKYLLETKRKEATVGDEAPTIEVIVNAEMSVAEVLRLRSIVARNQPYD